MLYTVAEAAEASGLAPGTIANYCHGRSDLRRGVDFITRRPNPCRSYLRITEAGLQRLILRQYRTALEYRSKASPSSRDNYLAPRQTVDYSSPKIEILLQIRALIRSALRQYETNACAVASCPCIIHRLGVPQADVMVPIFQKKAKVPKLPR